MDVKTSVKTESLADEPSPSTGLSESEPSVAVNGTLLVDQEEMEMEVTVKTELVPEENDEQTNTLSEAISAQNGSLEDQAKRNANVESSSDDSDSDDDSDSMPESPQPGSSRKRPLDEHTATTPQSKRVHVDASVPVPNQCPAVIELDLDEDEGISGDNLSAHFSDGARAGQVEGAPATTANGRRSGLRNRKPVDYSKIDNPTEEDADYPPEAKKTSSKGVFDVFAVALANPKRLDKLSKVENPDSMEKYDTCKLEFMNKNSLKTCQTRIEKFFHKRGSQFENIEIKVPYEPVHHDFLKGILRTTTFLSRIVFSYQHKDDAYCFLKRLGALVPTLLELKLISASGSNCLRKNHIELLAKLPPLKSLELGDALWQDVKQETVEALLNQHKETLETLVIHGGYRGFDNVEHSVNITFPKMAKLQNLRICPKYSFHSEIKDPYSKRAREITVDIHEREEPFKVSITFSSKIPTLRRLVLGNLIDVNDLYFSQVRELTEFRCGSYWNLAITFPPESSRKELLESVATELQFPDCLKDPTFVVKARKHFPNVKKVWLNLPSVPVLRAFFKAFEDSELTHLFLKTQFDFPKTMESCLLPNLQDVLKKSAATESLLNTLREYKHFDEYIRYHNVELPVEQDDLMESHSAGIAALKSLKVLHLEHIPRNLLIPFPDEERKWFDHNCKFMSTTFGYAAYPLSDKCHKQIRDLNLDEYIWKNLEISSANTKQFRSDGFQEMSIQTVEASASLVDDEEDIFEKVRRTKTGTSVKIMPSMLTRAFKPKAE